jgi:ribose/xylose/arabinose/galactoside ABC-type transport system permease subunit
MTTDRPAGGTPRPDIAIREGGATRGFGHRMRGLFLSDYFVLYLSLAYFAALVPFLPTLATPLMRDLGIGVPGGLATALLAGAALGAINAAAIVGLGILPFIVTLATLFAFRGFGAFLTGSRQFDFEPAMREFGLASVAGVPVPVVFFAILAVGAHVVLSRTTFGRQVYAIGNDPEAARKAGLPVASVRFRVYVISGACAGLAGFVMISQIGRLDAGFGEGREFDVIAAAVLGGASLFGGIGSAFGAVFGATLIQTVKTGLVFTGVNLYLQPILMAAIIFLAVLIDSLRAHRLQQRKRRTIRPVAR